MFAQFGRRTGSVKPGDVREFARRNVRVKMSGGFYVGTALERRDFTEIILGRTITAPGQPGLGQTGRQGRQIEGGLRLVVAAGFGVINHRRCRRNQHQVVRLGLARHFRKIVVTQGGLLGVGEVIWNIRLFVLQLDRAGGPLEPRGVVVRVVTGRWITGRRQRDAVGPGEGSKVIVKRVVLFDDDDNLFNRIIWFHVSTFHLPPALRAASRDGRRTDTINLRLSLTDRAADRETYSKITQPFIAGHFQSIPSVPRPLVVRDWILAG